MSKKLTKKQRKESFDAVARALHAVRMTEDDEFEPGRKFSVHDPFTDLHEGDHKDDPDMNFCPICSGLVHLRRLKVDDANG